jgi:hypothetical protein
MKKLIMIAAMVAAFGLGTAAAYAATSDKPPAPPGQPECEHGNSQAECRDDPSPNGKDCEAHGNKGGQNEDHCKTETTPTETTPTETTPEETTTPTETTTPVTTTPTSSTETTPQTETTPAETTPSGEEEQSPAQEPGVFTPPVQKSTQKASEAEVVSAPASIVKPSTAAQPAPFTP